jgi:hypothetical protein
MNVSEEGLDSSDVFDELRAEAAQQMREGLDCVRIHTLGSRISEIMISESAKAMAS